jgi:hypothetical protein
MFPISCIPKSSGVPLLAPVNSVAPVITGTAEVGEVLSASTGTWSGVPSSYAYQWQRNDGGGWVSIGGATSSTYEVVEADEECTLRVGGIASNAAGAGAEAFSEATAEVPAAPSGVAEVTTFDFTGLDSGQFDVGAAPAPYVLLSGASGRRYIWFQVTEGIDPAPGETDGGMEVDASSASDETNAEAFKVAVNADADWSASRAGAVVTVMDAASADRVDATMGTSGVVVVVTTQGEDPA